MSTSLAHQEPDRVAKGPLDMKPQLVEQLLGCESGEAFENQVLARDLLGADYVVAHYEHPARRRPPGVTRWRNIWGSIVEGSEFSQNLVKPAVTNPESIPHWQLPEPEDFSMAQITRWANETDYFVFGHIWGPFDVTPGILGFEEAMMATISHPEEMRGLSQRLMGLSVEVAKHELNAGADGIMIADDLAYKAGPFLSPDSFRSIFFPAFKWAVAKIKAFQDVPVILHTDGNINSLLPDIVAIGFDGIQAIQPDTGMDIARIKREFGDELVLMGNIDLCYLLTMGTPVEVVETVRETIRAAAPGGGFVLTASNVLTRDTKPENVLAMYKEAARWTYPIAKPERSAVE